MGVFGRLFGSGSDSNQTSYQDRHVSEHEQMLDLMVKLIKYYNAKLTNNQADSITTNLQSILSMVSLGQPVDSPTFRLGYKSAFNALIKGLAGSMRRSDPLSPFASLPRLPISVEIQHLSSYNVETKYLENQKKEWIELVDLFEKVGIPDTAKTVEIFMNKVFLT
jgi:hypothetical protein